MARRLQLWTTDPGRNHERATDKNHSPHPDQNARGAII
jgi:hypothetical protein